MDQHPDDATADLYARTPARCNALMAIANKIVDETEGQPLPYSHEDLRYTTLEVINTDITAAITLMHSITWQRSVDDVQQSFAAVISKHETGLATAHQFIRLSLVDRVYFHVDHLFETIARNAGEKSGTLTKALVPVLKLAGLAKNGPEHQCIVALQNSRNSMHNGGAHAHDDHTVSHAGHTYEFRKGELVLSGDWDHVVAMIDGVVDACVKVVRSPGVANLKGPFPTPIYEAARSGKLPKVRTSVL